MVKHINILLMKWLYTHKNSFVIFFLIFYIFINFVFIHYKGYNTLLNKNVREFSTFLLLKWHPHFLLKMYSLKFLYMFTMHVDYFPSLQIPLAFQTGHRLLFSSFCSILKPIIYCLLCNMCNLLVVNPQSKGIPTTSATINFQEIPRQS